MSQKGYNTIRNFSHQQIIKFKAKPKRYKIVLFIILLLLIWFIICLPSPLFDVPYSTVVNDRKGELLGARIADDGQWRFPTTDSLPEKYKICLTEFEDKHYKYHWGVNPLSIIRATKQNISQKKIVSGASTITMQTIRLSRKEKRTFGEKFIEMILAFRLEFSYSKNEILNLYASHAPMGGNVVGIDAASWRYFGHDAAKLSWAEAATLAILPNSPSMMHFNKNRDQLLTKRNNLLKKLYIAGELSEIDYELSVSELLPPHPHSLPQIAPHLVAKIHQERKGENIITTLDRYQQDRTEHILSKWNAEFAQNGINNIAAIIIDIDNNEIISYCGNVHFEKSISGNQVDIIQSARSTGSILKPFLYCAMQDEGLLLPNELVADVPININGFAPRNFSLQYDGATPASEALARSLNIPSVISLRKYGVAKFYNILKEGGMTTLNRSADNYGLSLILGGAEGKLWDVSCLYLQMAQSLNSFNNNNKYYQYQSPKYIVDSDQKSKDKEEIKKPLFKAGSSWLTLEALTNVNRPEEIDWKSIPSIQKIAWKTGTSYGFRDGWAVGVNSKYLVGVWVGNSDGEGRPGLTGARTAGMVMFDIFNSLPKSQWFQKPEKDLIQIEVCHESGCLKSINCPENSIDTIYTCKKGIDGKVCSYHKLVHLSEDMQYQVYQECAGNRGIVHTSWFILPPSWETYYKEQHPFYRSLPPYSPECSEDNNTKLMEFIYPFPNTIVNTPKQLDGSTGRLIFEIAHRNPQHKVFWHINDEYIGETKDIHKKEYIPKGKGKYKLTVVDENGLSIYTYFTIK